MLNRSNAFFIHLQVVITKTCMAAVGPVLQCSALGTFLSESSFFDSCEEKIKIIRTFYCCYHEILFLNVHSATSFSNKDCLHLLCVLSIYHFLGLILQILFSSVSIVRYSKIMVFHVIQSICLLYLK